jgi:hypothetical protein
MRPFRHLPRLAALPLLLLTAGVSCSSNEPTAAQPAPPAAPRGSLLSGLAGLPLVSSLPVVSSTLYTLDGNLLRCTVSQTTSASAVIGPAGGRLRVGKHWIDFPANAVSAPTLITATAPAGSVVVVDFKPHGLVFNRPPVLTLDYSGCTLPAGSAAQVVYTDGLLNILERLLSFDDQRDGLVFANLGHFSGYAVATRSQPSSGQ